MAKEFGGARDDEQGVLILSRFTGASRELRDALIVNPYDIDQMAEAVRAADLISALAQVRLEPTLQMGDLIPARGGIGEIVIAKLMVS